MDFKRRQTEVVEVVHLLQLVVTGTPEIRGQGVQWAAKQDMGRNDNVQWTCYKVSGEAHRRKQVTIAYNS